MLLNFREKAAKTAFDLLDKVGFAYKFDWAVRANIASREARPRARVCMNFNGSETTVKEPVSIIGLG